MTDLARYVNNGINNFAFADLQGLDKIFVKFFDRIENCCNSAISWGIWGSTCFNVSPKRFVRPASDSSHLPGMGIRNSPSPTSPPATNFRHPAVFDNMAIRSTFFPTLTPFVVSPSCAVVKVIIPSYQRGRGGSAPCSDLSPPVIVWAPWLNL